MVKKMQQPQKIAILLAEGFEEVELTKPRAALKKAGAETFLITPKGKKVRSWQHTKWGKDFKVDLNLKNAKPTRFDGLLLPGGVMNPDTLRANKSAIRFIDYFMKNNKPIAAICHGPWSLVETGKLKGRKLTSYHTIKTDLKNAGAIWQNKSVVRDKNLVTSRKPKDLINFNKAIIKLFKLNSSK